MATKTPTSPVSIRNTNSQSSKLSSGLKKASSSSSSALSGSSPSNKNLSHVPCKFFKQGACQAGSSCPFSHTMDAVEQAPCKYFQKGNCKFGSKCALAHILPDGRRVNTRGGQHPQNFQSNNTQQQQQPQQQQQQQQPQLPQQQQQQQQQHTQQQQSQLPSLSQSPVVSHGGHLMSNHQGLSSFNSSPGGPITSSNNISAHSLPHNLMGLNGNYNDTRGISSHDNNISSNSRLKTNIYSNEPSSPFSRSFADGIFTSPVGSARSVSSSANIWPHMRQNRQASSPFPPDDFAIDDDDPFEEDFVPSSLTDLLTPQERKRRGSRPSSSLSHTVPAGGIHPDIWGTNSNRISSPRMVRQSFSDNNANVSSSLKVLQPIGTPERTSSMTAASPAFNNSSNVQTNINSYSNLMSPKPVSTRREKEREILREDDNHETQFFMEEEIGEQEKRLQNLRLVNEQLY